MFARVLQFCLTLSLLQHVVLAGHMHRHMHHMHHQHRELVARQAQTVDVDTLISGIQSIEESMGNPSLSSSFVSWIQGVADRIKSIDLVVVLGPSQTSATSTPAVTPPAATSTSISTSSSSVAISQAPTFTPAPSTPTTSLTSAAPSTATSVAHAKTSGASAASGTGSTFSPSASNNVVVYYGQTPNTKSDGSDLLHICQDPNVSIVNMAFIYEYFSTNNFPATDFGPACWAAKNSIAPSVYDCSPYASMIQTCQANGKKVFISIGGAVGQSTFASHDQAVTFASNVWNMFGNPEYTDSTFTLNGATYNWVDFRPFGPNIIIDGVDIDNESNDPNYYTDFVEALRQNYANDTSGREYYISSAPQCPYPDASNPQPMLAQLDIVNVQFYDNYCNIGTSGFIPSVLQWSEFLGNSTWRSSAGAAPQLFVGIAAESNVGSGYIAAADLGSWVDQVKALNLGNFGGLMMWDGTEALNNIDANGNNFLDVAAGTLY